MEKTVSDIEKSRQPVDPFTALEGANSERQIEFVNSKCLTCGAMGEWTQVLRDDRGHMTQYTDFDASHYKESSLDGTKGHREFHHFTLTRTHARLFML